MPTALQAVIHRDHSAECRYVLTVTDVALRVHTSTYDGLGEAAAAARVMWSINPVMACVGDTSQVALWREVNARLRSTRAHLVGMRNSINEQEDLAFEAALDAHIYRKLNAGQHTGLTTEERLQACMVGRIVAGYSNYKLISAELRETDLDIQLNNAAGM